MRCVCMVIIEIEDILNFGLILFSKKLLPKFLFKEVWELVKFSTLIICMNSYVGKGYDLPKSK